MNERPTSAYIPPNLSGGGTILGGMLQARNLIEAVISIPITIILFFFLGKFLPSIMTLLLGVVCGILFFVLCLTGLYGEPVSIFILNILNYNKTKSFVTIRMPMPYEDMDRELLEEERAKNSDIGTIETKGLEGLLRRLMYGDK